MGGRNRGFSEDESVVSDSLSDALLFTTMCIVGLPVDVHVRDGSVYSGIFHTACVENDYAIVLKRARVTKKGTCAANVEDRRLVETLIIQSEDLVQLVAKGIPLPDDGNDKHLAAYDIGSIAETVPSLVCQEEARPAKPCKPNTDSKQILQARCSVHVENGFTSKLQSCEEKGQQDDNEKSDGLEMSKKEESSSLPVKGRQAGDSMVEGKQNNYKSISKFGQKRTGEVHGSSSRLDAGAVHSSASDETDAKLPNGVPCHNPAPSIARLDDQSVKRHSSAYIPCSDTVPSGVPAAVPSAVTVISESCPSSSSTQTILIPPKNPSSDRTTKEFKLNPRAKIFSPTFAHHGPVTSATVPTVANMTYIPDNCPVLPIATAQPEIEISDHAPHSSLPVKFVPYGSDSQYSQPIVGHVGSRTQPARYTSQYHPVQVGPTYVYQNPQNVIGRLGPLVYMHPVSHDVLTAAPAFSQVSTRPLLTPHQIHLPKHQGGAAVQAVQLCVTPPLIAASGQQPFTPGHISLAPPPFPVIQTISVPGSNNGFLGSKFS